MRVEGDVGGFGIGSDFAWWLIFGVDWRFANRWTLMLAYAFLDVDYGSAADFAWNLQLQGPSLGIQFSF